MRVGDEQLSVLQPNSLRAAHGLRRRRIQRKAGGEIGLAQYHVRRLIVLCGNRVPDEYAVAVGIGNHQAHPVRGDGGRIAQARARGLERGVDGGEVLLPQHHVGLAYADRTALRIIPLGRGRLEHARDIAINEDAVVARRRADPVGIGHKQHVIGIGYAAGSADDGIGWGGVLPGKLGLANHCASGLPRVEVGGKQRRGAKHDQNDTLHVFKGTRSYGLKHNYSKPSGNWGIRGL